MLSNGNHENLSNKKKNLNGLVTWQETSARKVLHFLVGDIISLEALRSTIGANTLSRKNIECTRSKEQISGYTGARSEPKFPREKFLSNMTNSSLNVECYKKYLKEQTFCKISLYWTSVR